MRRLIWVLGTVVLVIPAVAGAQQQAARSDSSKTIPAQADSSQKQKKSANAKMGLVCNGVTRLIAGITATYSDIQVDSTGMPTDERMADLVTRGMIRISCTLPPKPRPKSDSSPATTSPVAAPAKP